MPIQPRPIAGTVRPPRPSLRVSIRVSIMVTPEEKIRTNPDNHVYRCSPLAEGSGHGTKFRTRNKARPARSYRALRLAALLAGQLHRLTEALGGVAHNHSHNAARKHDF